MKTMRAAKYMLVMACAVVAASFALAGTAFAASVHGADYQGSGSALESGQIDVLNVDGKAGETVFITVSRGRAKIAHNLPYTIGENADAGDEATWAGIATLDIDGLDLTALDGTYKIDVYSDRAGSEQLYSGAIYGVYADLPDGTTKLIGTRTANADEAAARDFAAPATVFVNGRTYKLTGKTEGKDSLHFAYVEYDEATTVDGVINYLDSDGNVIAKSEIPGIAYNEEVKVDVPEVVVADNGDLYRTVFFKKSITAKNPGAVSFSIYCTKISDADKALAGYYVATIKMVNEDGKVIATDTVDVTGNFVYTAPTYIYKKEKDTSIGAPAVVTYTVQGSPTIYLSAANDGVVNRARTITVQYATTDPESPSVDVVYNRIDGSKDAGDKGRKLGTQEVTVTLDSPTATPDPTIEVDGTTYNLVGDAGGYAYTIRSGEIPSINAYYLPEGYEPPGPREVTVNYVNYATDSVIESHTYTSDPNDIGPLTIESPETFSADGVNYIRLDGQEEAISHNYYSGIATYAVYYRDENDTLSNNAVISRTRYVYRDRGVTAADNNAAANGGGNNAAAAAGDDTAAADNAAADDNAQNLQLNTDNTYNVFDGEDGNGTMTNQSGVDSNTERIEDNETPLASGFDKGGSSSAASSLSSNATWMIPAGIALVVILIGVAVFWMIRRRKNDEYDA